MAEWRLWRSWPAAAIKLRLEQARHSPSNVGAHEEEMTGDHGWHHFYSEAVIATEAEGEDRFGRARAALANYQFSAPAIVLAHFDQAEPLLWRCMLLEVQVLGLHHLCPAIVNRVTDEADVFGFRDDTLEGHLERGVEWFLLTRNDQGQIRFRIEARWQQGEFPNWWSRIGFIVLSGYYQRKWHRLAHHRLWLLAHYGSTRQPPRDAAGPTHQGVDVVFTYHTNRKWFQ
ncbi:hypothetical protein LuPra_01350 [Luteitalea pratensis]|uniref:DUF1990 domain-containing protein n=1 Tax=Luteitalea pratensis TaxID=1855912 RepID=A0A143PIT5_LUTPR|nr:DUF1990 family protein [Luteitalea pratensis]AMY08160.1 hypothetical protein LuPra_01350 [Luteitalea pratensis]